MDKIRSCVSDLFAIANSVAAQDLSEAKRRLELLFADAQRQAEVHFHTAQRVRDQLGQAIDQSHGITAKRFLNELITWLDREHLGRGIGT
jgi:hypothetical protein